MIKKLDNIKIFICLFIKIEADTVISSKSKQNFQIHFFLILFHNIVYFYQNIDSLRLSKYSLRLIFNLYI